MTGDYEFYDGICSHPYYDWHKDDISPWTRWMWYDFDDFSWAKWIYGTTRSVCRQLCSTVYDDMCSGFLFYRDFNLCVITSYTGEWTNESRCNETTVEFYRRHRSVGKSASALFLHRICNLPTQNQVETCGFIVY
jgi:hypothetical protein